VAACALSSTATRRWRPWPDKSALGHLRAGLLATRAAATAVNVRLPPGEAAGASRQSLPLADRRRRATPPRAQRTLSSDDCLSSDLLRRASSASRRARGVRRRLHARGVRGSLAFSISDTLSSRLLDKNLLLHAREETRYGMLERSARSHFERFDEQLYAVRDRRRRRAPSTSWRYLRYELRKA